MTILDLLNALAPNKFRNLFRDTTGLPRYETSIIKDPKRKK
ncbi:hypothetical protein U879_20090 [Defluviimonas sp. 20V17]|nr:hypothetical protein U879_20090 [Defluviimonas sp. 20V17]